LFAGTFMLFYWMSVLYNGYHFIGVFEFSVTALVFERVIEVYEHFSKGD